MELQTYPFLLLIIIFFTTIKLSLTYRRNRKLPPGLYKLPLIGNLHQLANQVPHHKLHELAQKHNYSDLMHMKLGQVDHIVVLSAQAAKEITTTHDLTCSSRPFLLAPSIIGYGGLSIAFSPYGAHWRQMRKLCVLELLNPGRVKASSSIRKEEVRNLVESILNMGDCGAVNVNVTEKIMGLTATMTSRAAFGAKFEGTERFMKVAKKAIEMSSGFSLVDVFPGICGFLGRVTGTKAKLEDMHKELDGVLSEIVEENRRRRGNNKNRNRDVEDGGLLDILLSIMYDDSSEYPLTISMVKSVIFDMIIGGTDTTSATLIWAMAELIRHPEIMKKVQSEIQTILNHKPNIEEEDLQKMKYMKQVIKETLRMYPPLPLLIPRECSKSISIMGYTIPSGSRILINAWAIGRDLKYWEAGECFKPERFDFESEEVDYFGGKRVGYLSFGGGRRACPGMNFGTVSVEIVLANLLYHFDWKLPEGVTADDLDMTESTGSSVARKDDLWLVAEPSKFPDKTV